MLENIHELQSASEIMLKNFISHDVTTA